MKRIYLDNAATTCLSPEVMEAMVPYMTTEFGNPSSGHAYGRTARMAIENSRKTVARLLNALPSEIIFTSGGTESNNTAIQSAIIDQHCTHIITSAIEHHAVLHTVQQLSKRHQISYSLVRLFPDGHIDLEDLEAQVKKTTQRCLVSLMHANNEIGNLLDLQAVGVICQRYNAIFHSDCVQSVGHYPLDLEKIPAHFISASAHKFHGPKGTGILYVRKGLPIKPLIIGGGQEKQVRGGTENVVGIVGFARALESAMQHYEKEASYIQSLKTHLLDRLQASVEGLRLHGDAAGKSLYTVLNVGLPKNVKTEGLLFYLDLNNICVSGGSACSTGHNSHVIQAIYRNADDIPLRLSFSKYNTIQEIDTVIAAILSG